MPSNWRKIVVVLALLIVVVGALMPDACAEGTIASDAPTSATLCIPHTGDLPFGCQHEEDCFCCAHIVPLEIFEIYPYIAFARVERQQYSSVVEYVPFAPYHPPRT